MNIKQFSKKYWQTGAIIIVVLIAGAYVGARNARKTQPVQNEEQTNMEQNQAVLPSAILETPGDEGTLQNSDNSAKGNLMLVTPTHILYINTSRDFNSLVGKKVNVTYQGNLQSFKLGDITAE